MFANLEKSKSNISNLIAEIKSVKKLEKEIATSNSKEQ